ncbi:hypothetical protein B0H94_12024 [Salsuginibacillus halophilus]|uniref:ComK protein n=2 Tax=Salsuginibacillus halophilus TaxID=517424 RepID=A0A2P8H4Y7_9BACI|nr:hypothetical protein B0H94_12024 [Salsuginibacillus halophilus]
MKKDAVQVFVSRGEAFIPVYEPGAGDAVRILLCDGGSEDFPMSSDAFLKALFDHYGLSVPASKRRYGYFLQGKRQLVPMPVSDGITLIPYHTREAIGKQTRTGWVRAAAITSLQQDREQETVIATSAHSFAAFHSKRFCFEQLKNARWLEHCYKEVHNIDAGDKTPWKFFTDVRGAV